MKDIIALSRLAVVAIAIVTAGSAAAKDLRYPEKGEVAFVLHFPDEVTTRDDGIGNLIVTSPDRSWALSLARADDSLSAKSSDEVAKEVLAAATAEPYSAHEPAMISDNKAEAYRSKMTNGKGTPVTVRLVITKVDRTYLTESILTLSALTASQQKFLDRTLGGISLTGFK
jgi:hypothetical protein